MSGASGHEGRLLGVGVGPGDPELLTIKATRIIAEAPVIAYFARKGARGIARGIVDRWIGPACVELALSYPLTTEVSVRDPAYAIALQAFYAQAGERIADHLRHGRDVALVCEGDPLFYGSFIHLYAELKGRFAVEIVPGITGMAGCWSAAKVPIACGDDVFSVLPGTLGAADLARHLAASDAVVIIKLGANLAKVRQAVTEAGRMQDAVYIEHGTSTAEQIARLAEKADDVAPYFALIVIPGRGRHPAGRP
jgi:precorrin-2/cobalt-factor-2 C20-methyltransferase